MAKYRVLAPLHVSFNWYTAAIMDDEGQIWSGRLNLDTWCLTPASSRHSRNICPATVKSKLKPLTDAERALLDQEHPEFAYSFVWGADE